MKIALVSQPIDTLLPPFQNSVGACTYGAACSLAKSHEVTVLGLQDRHDAGGSFWHRGVRFRFLPSTLPDRLLLNLRNKWSKLVQMSSPLSTSAWLFPDYGRQVAAELAKEHYDVIHIQHCSQYVPVIRKLNPGAKIDLQLHAEWFSQCKPSQLATRLQGVDLLSAVSNHITQKTRRDVPSLAGRCETIYNGINIEEFSQERNYQALGQRRIKRIMYAGGVSPHKGLHVLINAFKILVQHYPDVRLDIIGPQGSYPLEETFDLNDRALIQELKPFYTKNTLALLKAKLTGFSSLAGNYISHLKAMIPADLVDKIAFLGMIPRPELVQRYYDADLFVFPPIWDEGFGIPPVEAMAAGAAVVASRSGAIVETVQHGRTGLLVDKNDPSSLADAMMTLLTNDGLREQMGRAGRQQAQEHFTWDGVANVMSDRFRTLLAVNSRDTSASGERAKPVFTIGH
jgi:glycosyltransferase involved in cell wall biosynthesis